MDSEPVIEEIRRAFQGVPWPGGEFLLGSREGCEPFEEIGPFTELTDWTLADPAMLDAHSAALSFFSEAGFRFFLPAYLIADLRGQLRTADPLFHLAHGFHDISVRIPTGDGAVEKKIGRGAFVNPRRFGAMTFYDYARCRLSVFTREEARAIVAYLECKRTHFDPREMPPQEIDDALASFWRDRADHAPTQAEIRRRLEEDAGYLEGSGG